MYSRIRIHIFIQQSNIAEIAMEKHHGMHTTKFAAVGVPNFSVVSFHFHLSFKFIYNIVIILIVILLLFLVDG
jgi:hypothetical protein